MYCQEWIPHPEHLTLSTGSTYQDKRIASDDQIKINSVLLGSNQYTCLYLYPIRQSPHRIQSQQSIKTKPQHRRYLTNTHHGQNNSNPTQPPNWHPQRLYRILRNPLTHNPTRQKKRLGRTRIQDQKKRQYSPLHRQRHQHVENPLLQIRIRCRYPTFRVKAGIFRF